MKFVHEDRAFRDLLRIVADEQDMSPAMVEKDYWVTHSLWALGDVGLDVWFKGGTSLSKGYGLIRRFSEDLDLKIDPGRVIAVPHITNWNNTNAGWIEKRRAYFNKLGEVIVVPGAPVVLDEIKKDVRDAMYRVDYPGHFARDLPPPMRPFVQLEVGSARVVPSEPRNLSSFVHDSLAAKGQLDRYRDNRPMDVRCVHPLVTLAEKLNALSGGWEKRRAPVDFVRHYEDAAWIIRQVDKLPPLPAPYRNVDDLVGEMIADRGGIKHPRVADPAWNIPSGAESGALRDAYDELVIMFWGERIPLGEACDAIRSWVAALRPAAERAS